MYVISFKCKISMPHHPEMLAEHEGRARASTLHFSCPESRGMLCVTFLHLYVFLLRRTLPRNGQGFPEPQNRLTFSTSIVQTATAKLLFAPLSREHSIKLWFKANIKGDGEPLVPLYGCWNPNVCLDSTKDKIRDRAGAVFHSRHYSHGASHNRGLVLQFVNDGGPTFCPRCHDEKHNAINLFLSNLICFCSAREKSCYGPD